MANVFASAGAAARAANDLNMLQMQARKMVRQENNMPAKAAKEKDLESGRSQDLHTQRADLANKNAQQWFMVGKAAIIIGTGVAGALAAGKSKEEGLEATGNAEEVQQKADLQKNMDMANYADLALQSANQVIAVVQSGMEIHKNNKNRKTLAAEAASADAATQSLDSTGRA